MEGVLVIKTCLTNFTASSTEGVLVMKNVSVKLFSFINGGSIGDEERVCQTLQFLLWRQYWWSRTCLSISSVSSMEGLLVIKNVSVKLFSFFIGGSIGDQNVSAQFYSFFNGGSIGDEERVCQTLQLLQWREYWWSKRVCPILQLLQRREYWWWRMCLSNSSASSMEGVLVMKNVSVKLFSFFCGGSIGDQERVCHSLQFHQWRDYWWLRTCLSNSSASSMEGVLVIKTCLPNFTASSTEGVLVMKNVSVKLFSFFSGGSIGDQERVCQTLRLL